MSFADLLHTLEYGDLFAFRDWPNPDAPQVCAGVYTVWQGEHLLYVGMAGRSLTEDEITTHRAANARAKGLYSRLNSHASGRRSGD